MTVNYDITLPGLHRSQQIVRDDPARFKVLACGRRWGKTGLGSVMSYREALKGGRSWWIAPTYKMANVGWRLIKGMAVQHPGCEISKVERLILAPGGGTVQIRSADDPDSLRGDGLSLCVLDECAFMKSEAWTHAIRPALSDRRGSALFIGTPSGRNWFHRLYLRGLDGTDEEWASWRFPTSDNPLIDPDEIEAARNALPERIFLQEYEAVFLEDGGGVFRGVAELATVVPTKERVDGHEYVFGVDWGRTADYTVITVLDSTSREMVYMDRFTRIDYATQIGRLKSLASEFAPVQIIAELNSMGGPLVEQLRNDGLPVKGFQTTNASKEEAIRALEGAFDRQEIRILNDPVLIGELQSFEQKQLPAGRFRFEAPAGVHDDCVISLAIAYHAISNRWLAW